MTLVAVDQEKRQRRSLLRTQRIFSQLHGLQKEVQELKLQLARLEEATHSKQTENNYNPQSQEELKPRRQPPPGKTAMQMIQGQWPGKESTEELLAQLEALR